MTRYARPPFREPRMKAITLWQPWAWAIARAGKRIENREWSPGRELRQGEPVAIHASYRLEDCGFPVGAPGPPGASEFVRVLDKEGRRIAPDPEDAACILGGVVAVAIFDRVIRSEPRGLQAGWWVGPVGWVFSEVTSLALPVPCSGKQKIWRLGEAESERVLELWARELI